MQIKTFLFMIVFITAFLQKPAAQNGYSITINTKNATGAKLKLALYEGTYNKPTTIDSAVINSNQDEIHFTQNKKIFGAIYQLSLVVNNDSLANKADKINIAVDNGAVLQFVLKGTSLSAITAQSQLNADFILLQNEVKNGEDKQRLLQNLVKKYPTSVVALWATLELKKTETDNLSKIVNRVEYRNNYFKNVDLQDKRIQILPNMYSSLYDYIMILPVTDSNYSSSVNNLLKDMDCRSRNYFFYLEWIFKNLIYLQHKHLEKTYNYVYNTYLNKDTCRQLNTALYTQVTHDLDKLINLPVGSILPSFKMSDSTGKIYTIDSPKLNAPFTFIAFYDPDCSHCQETMPKVAAYFKDHFQNRVLGITFYNAPFEVTKWQTFIQKSNLTNWMNVKPAGNDTKYMLDLKLSGNPNFFLIDNTGKILLKSFDTQMLDKILSSN